MKICIVTPYFTPFIRGNEYGLAESLSKLGNQVTVITSKSKAPREKPFGGELIRNLPFNLIYLRTIVDFSENPLVTNMLNNLIKKFDVVMLQEDYPLICHSAFFAAKMHDVTTVLSSERTYIPADFKKRTGLAIFDLTVSRLLREEVNVFTVHCSASKRFLRDAIGVKRNIEVVHVGVNSYFRPIKDPIDYIDHKNEDLRILSVARFHRYKGLNYLIMAMKKVVEEVDAELYLLGKGEEELHLKKLAERLNISKHVNFVTKSIPNKEMPHVYSSCDVYVQPSIIEPFGIAVLEAMACQKPVIGTNVGGMLDTISHGKTGFRAKPTSSEEIARYIIKLSDGKLRRKMGRNARRKAEKFDWIEIGKKYIKLIT